MRFTRIRSVGCSFEAWNRAEIFIDGAQFVFGQTLEIRPRHDQQQVPIEGLLGRGIVTDPSRRRGARSECVLCAIERPVKLVNSAGIQ